MFNNCKMLFIKYLGAIIKYTRTTIVNFSFYYQDFSYYETRMSCRCYFCSCIKFTCILLIYLTYCFKYKLISEDFRSWNIKIHVLYRFINFSTQFTKIVCEKDKDIMIYYDIIIIKLPVLSICLGWFINKNITSRKLKKLQVQIWKHITLVLCEKINRNTFNVIIINIINERTRHKLMSNMTG